ncbi:MAG: glycosyltransferase family 39 protein [Chloroflexi bacterium]|nr:glycosyltransferase family 39 protein [Chloroflexota bacterium]
MFNRFGGTKDIKSDVAIRLLSALIGTATIPLMFVLARRLFDETRVALFAACVIALSPLHIYYSQEARMYGLVTLLGLASVYLFVELFHLPVGKPKTALVVIAYILTSAAALYTQYYAAFILAAQVVVVLVLFARRSPFVRIHNLPHWFGAWIGTALLYVPWIFFAGEKLVAYVTGKVTHEAFAPLTPITFTLDYAKAFSVGHISELKWIETGTALFVALAILGVLDAWRNFEEHSENADAPPIFSAPWRESGIIALLFLLIPFALGYLVNLRFPFHPLRSERLLLLAVPAFYILIALGINALWERRALIGALALVIVAAISSASLYDFYIVARYPKDDYRPLVAQMQTLAQSGDHFLAIYPWQIGYLETYYRGAPLTIFETPSDAWINQREKMHSDLDALLAKNSRVWLPALQTLGRILEDALDANLRARAYSLVDDWHGTTRLELFAFGDDPAPNDRPLAIGGVPFNARGISNAPIPAGAGDVRVWLDTPSTDNLKLSLRLVDANGNVWTQTDRELARGMQRIGIPVLIGTPAGAYTIKMNLYHTNGARLGAEDVTLGSVQVVEPVKIIPASIPNHTAHDFETGIQLIGYDTPPEFRPGIATPITLFWEASPTARVDARVIAEIQDWRGNVFASTQAPLARGIYQLNPQIIVPIRDPQTLTLRGDTPDGLYRLLVGWFDPQTNSRMPLRAIANIAVKNRAHYFGAPSPQLKFDARFGNVARLVGYDMLQSRIVVYWQATAITEKSYTVFVHLVDDTGTIRAQRDQIPGAGAFPTTSWVKGEYIIDVYDLPISPGDYKIRIGMYDALTGARVPVLDANNQPIGDYSEPPTRISVQ